MPFIGLPASLQPQVGAGAVGRPKTAGKYTLLPLSKNQGWKHNDPDPSVVKQVHEQYMKAGELPPHLRPQRSSAFLKKKNDSISRGFKNPRGGL